MLVTGGSGFVGRHLVRHLRELGEEPAAPTREELDLLDAGTVRSALRDLRPSAVFHLAARASVKRSWERPAEALAENIGMTVNVLEAVRLESPRAAVLLAGSGEVYGPPERLPVDEQAPLRPQNPYAVSKATCDLLGGQYADSHGMRVVRTRAFNHESPRRGLEFVTRKVTHAAAAIKLGLQQELGLGNLDAERDWGYAQDYVNAMWLMVQQDEPEDYVIATGETHSVRELVDVAFDHVGLDPAEYVRTDPRFLRPAEVEHLVGDCSKAREKLGWEPRVRFEELVRLMVDADLELLGRGVPQKQAG